MMKKLVLQILNAMEKTNEYLFSKFNESIQFLKQILNKNKK
tara:strand:+ start:982 stop:1104 length:123 start_codon:yes stop_codon:yes gene_type:complete